MSVSCIAACVVALIGDTSNHHKLLYLSQLLLVSSRMTSLASLTFIHLDECGSDVLLSPPLFFLRHLCYRQSLSTYVVDLDSDTKRFDEREQTADRTIFFFLLVAAVHKFELLVEFSTMTIFVDPRDIFNSGESVFFFIAILCL